MGLGDVGLSLRVEAGDYADSRACNRSARMRADADASRRQIA